MHLPALRVYDAPPVQTLQSGGFMHVLLMGLDLPGMTAAQQDTDKALRAQLSELRLSYGVVYGLGGQRLQAALRLIDPPEMPAPRWRGVCEKCADPGCEFQLFTALKKTRAADPALW